MNIAFHKASGFRGPAGSDLLQYSCYRDVKKVTLCPEQKKKKKKGKVNKKPCSFSLWQIQILRIRSQSDRMCTA